VLHELRHLWQIKNGWEPREVAEAEADAWAAERVKTLTGNWQSASIRIPNRAEKRAAAKRSRRRQWR